MALRLGIAAQVVIENKTSDQFIKFQLKRFVSGAFNVDIIGSTCTALPRVGVEQELDAEAGLGEEWKLVG